MNGDIRKSPRWLRLLALVFVLALTAAACGNDDDGGAITEPDTDPTTTTAAADANGATTDGATQLTISAMDISFDTAQLDASPGEISVTFENNDGGIPHNFKVSGPDEEFSTEITEGPDTQTVSFTITEPGTYTYICEVHPSQMGGELVIG